MHRYWNIVKNKCCAYGEAAQRPVLSLGGINDSSEQAWWQAIEACDEMIHNTGSWRYSQRKRRPRARPAGYGVQLRLEAMEL